MFFNNFNITHTSDDLPHHVGVMRNEKAQRGLTGSVAALAGVTEQMQGGDFLISPDGLTHIDWSRVKQGIQGRYPYMIHDDLGDSRYGYKKGADVNVMPSLHTASQSFKDVISLNNPSSHCFEAQDDTDEDFPLLSWPDPVATGDKIPQRPCVANLHNGSATDALSLRRRNYTGTAGRPNANEPFDYGSMTMFFVWHPFVNGDGSGLSYPGASGADGTIKNTFFFSATSGIRMKDTGGFQVKANSQSYTGVALNGQYNMLNGIAGANDEIYIMKWDINYYLTGDGFVANGKPTAEPIMFCIDILTDKSAQSLREHQTFKTVSNSTLPVRDRIDDHTTWWHHLGDTGGNTTIVNYNHAMGSSDKSLGIWIYNQYGVPVGWETAVSSSYGKELMRLSSIGQTGSGSGTNNIHGYHCETIITPVPLSMNKKLQMLAHLRKKWGISDSYTNGKPYHL